MSPRGIMRTTTTILIARITTTITTIRTRTTTSRRSISGHRHNISSRHSSIIRRSTGVQVCRTGRRRLCRQCPCLYRGGSAKPFPYPFALSVFRSSHPIPCSLAQPLPPSHYTLSRCATPRRLSAAPRHSHSSHRRQHTSWLHPDTTRLLYHQTFAIRHSSDIPSPPGGPRLSHPYTV